MTEQCCRDAYLLGVGRAIASTLTHECRVYCQRCGLPHPDQPCNRPEDK